MMQACHCGKPAADDPRSSGMCAECYQADCEGGVADAIKMGENMRRYGCIDTPAAVLEAERQRNALAELEEFYGELRNAKSQLARRALTHIHALVNELHDACQLLVKYRQHVQGWAGHDGLDSLGHPAALVTFTPAEVAALRALRSKEVPQ